MKQTRKKKKAWWVYKLIKIVWRDYGGLCRMGSQLCRTVKYRGTYLIVSKRGFVAGAAMKRPAVQSHEIIITLKECLSEANTIWPVTSTVFEPRENWPTWRYVDIGSRERRPKLIKNFKPCRLWSPKFNLPFCRFSTSGFNHWLKILTIIFKYLFRYIIAQILSPVRWV